MGHPEGQPGRTQHPLSACSRPTHPASSAPSPCSVPSSWPPGEASESPEQLRPTRHPLHRASSAPGAPRWLPRFVPAPAHRLRPIGNSTPKSRARVTEMFCNYVEGMVAQECEGSKCSELTLKCVT